MAIWLARHGETEWTVSGRHTGSTDIALIREGELQAIALGTLLAERSFAHVFASPMRRAQETARLAGFGERFEVVEDLREVDYGEYEGVTTAEVHDRDPGWELFRDGSPGGESPEQMTERVDRLLSRLKGLRGDVLLFGHGHTFRVTAARFLGLPISSATNLRLDAGTLSILAVGRDGPSLVVWNRRVPARAVVVADTAARIARSTP
jgi:broad specificity phosphatase PhoE